MTGFTLSDNTEQWSSAASSTVAHQSVKSAAFDTINHQMLLSVLSELGLTGSKAVLLIWVNLLGVLAGTL